jgi:hypothetical protein
VSRAEELASPPTRTAVDEILATVEKLRGRVPAVEFNLLRCLLAERLVATLRKDGVTYDIEAGK